MASTNSCIAMYYDYLFSFILFESRNVFWGVNYLFIYFKFAFSAWTYGQAQKVFVK